MWDLDNFYDPIHFHEEFQITLILKGVGYLFVADNAIPFREGETYLFGKNLPHVLKSNKELAKNSENKNVKAITVFFSQDLIMNSLSQIPEAYSVQRLIDHAIYGIKVSEKISPSISKSLHTLTRKEGFDKYLLLLKILQKISKDSYLKFVSSTGVPIHTVIDNVPKINKVFDYIRENYQKKITLEEIANYVNMSPTAFSRYFKYKTQKTFSRVLIEVRIGNACKFLIQDNMSTTECCYSCGFNSISNFHRHFKSVTGFTPLEYRKQVLNKN